LPPHKTFSPIPAGLVTSPVTCGNATKADIAEAVMADATPVRARLDPAATFLAGIVELGLASTGLWFTLFSGENDTANSRFLAIWATVATIYLLVGGAGVRRRAFAEIDAPPRALPAWSTVLAGRRFSFLLTIGASLTGLSAALDALRGSDGERRGLVTGLSAWVMFCAWLLLSVGYARFYSQWTQWRFPKTEHPQLGDFLYFAVTVAVSFAVSDVEVRSHRLRWHVMVHSVISFFYNAIVLAVAVSIIIRK
jgi:uncharacterized membrane protein